MAFLRDNFHDIAAGNFMAESDHVAVHLCTDALVTDFGVNSVSKINRSGAGGKFKNSAFGCKGINFIGSEIDF